MSGTGLLSIAEAVLLPPDLWDGLGAGDLDLTEANRQRTARVWLSLCAVSEGSADAGRVRREVLRDGGLTVALSLPAVEFVAWFRAAPWAEFDSTDRTGSEAWAMAALQRAWSACESMGVLASQRALLAARGSAAAAPDSL